MSDAYVPEEPLPCLPSDRRYAVKHLLRVLSAWIDLLTVQIMARLNRAHVTTDPACIEHLQPKPNTRLDRASRGLECSRCLTIRALTDALGGEGDD